MNLVVGEKIVATLRYVSDGDTIFIHEMKQSVRLAYIDTPEKTQSYGLVSKTALSTILEGAQREGSLTIEAVQAADQYGRIVGLLYYNHRNINLWMLEEGHAWCYRSLRPPQEYKDAEDRARAAKRGLWASEETCSLPPWEYRKQKKNDPSSSESMPIQASSHADFKGEKLTATLQHISDGDTIFIQEKKPTVRFAYIDTPEKTQTYGLVAKSALSTALDGAYAPGSLTIETVQPLDQYGRIVGIVYYRDRNINLWMVEEGHAWCYRSLHPPQEYIDAEDRARAAKRGLWASNETCALPPWEYRKQKKSELTSNEHPAALTSPDSDLKREKIPGTLRHISDGDTIFIQEMKQPIRFAYIDTPEKTQAYGLVSRSALSTILEGANITASLTIEPVQAADQYGRIVGLVYYRDRNVNLWMLEEGHAWCYRSLRPPQEYMDAEDRARVAKRGLWASSETCALPPWEYRKQKKNESSPN